MKQLRRLLFSLMMGIAAVAASVGAWAVPAYQLGFALDGSGSVSTANYNLLRSGLSAALAGIPADGTIEITIVTYGSSTTTVTAPTLLTAATLPTIQAAITSHAKAGGGTDTAGAITTLTNLLTNSSVFSDPNVKSLINLATDGVPNSQSAAEAAAVAAFNAGIDALSIEAIGSGVNSTSALNNMAAIAFPDTVTILAVNSTNIPNPTGGSFVVPVSDFDALAPVLLAKVRASVNIDPNPVPEPATLTLLSVALFGLGLTTTRRRKN